MPIIPTIRCQCLRASISFDTQVLDVECAPGSGQDDPAFGVVEREGAAVFLDARACAAGLPNARYATGTAANGMGLVQ